MSFPKVNDAIQDILQNSSVQGTSASASYTTEQVYSAKQFAFKLGVDVNATGLPASISGSLGISQNELENIIVAQFTQVYYTVSFEAPEHPYSVFADGVNFDDPDNQIGEDNPPLYVSDVGYGRQVFLFLRSSFGSTQVEAALKGAASGEAASVKVDANFTYQDVMSKTSVTYVVRGGNAGLALAAIDAAKNDPGAMFDAVKTYIASKDAANYSASSPGIPVSYTLRYLTNNQVALKGDTITYDRRDCRTYPPEDYQITLRIKNPLQSAWVYLDSTDNLIAGPYRGDIPSVDVDLDSLLPDSANHTLIVQVYARCLWESAAVDLALYVDGARRWSDTMSKSWLQTCQLHNLIGGVTTLFPNEAYEARLKVSSRTGKVQLLSLSK